VRGADRAASGEADHRQELGGRGDEEEDPGDAVGERRAAGGA